jgi:hypothetical protein
MRAYEPTACMIWRMQPRAYVDVGAGVGVSVGGVLGVAVLGTAVLQLGAAHSVQPWGASLFEKGASHTVQWQARCTMAQARWDHLGAALGVAVVQSRAA